jgi:hypothetical protein
MDILPIEELRETRRRLAAQCASDVQRYGAMLQEFSRTLPGVYITKALLPPQSPVLEEIGQQPE